MPWAGSAHKSTRSFLPWTPLGSLAWGIFLLYFSHSCDKMPGRTSLQKNFFTLGLQPAKAGRHGPRSLRQLTTRHSQTERENWSGGCFSPFCLFIQSVSEAYRMVLLALRQVFPPWMSTDFPKDMSLRQLQFQLTMKGRYNSAILNPKIYTSVLYSSVYSSGYRVCHFSA